MSDRGLPIGFKRKVPAEEGSTILLEGGYYTFSGTAQMWEFHPVRPRKSFLGIFYEVVQNGPA